MGNGIWTSGRTDVRGALAREFDLNSPTARGNWDGKVYTGPLSHGREFTPEEMGETTPTSSSRSRRSQQLHPLQARDGDRRQFDMWRITKALRDVNNGIVILDHSPAMVGGNYTQTAYGFAYMKALLARANAEAR